jgi:F0F1-type ATP synthase alpha subunit
VVLLYVASGKALLQVPVNQINSFKDGFREHMAVHNAALMQSINTDGKLDDEGRQTIDRALEDYLREMKNDPAAKDG